VIAAINGHAVGIGITMTLPMDMRIVSEEAKIGFPFTRRDVVPEACSSWFLPRIVGGSPRPLSGYIRGESSMPLKRRDPAFSTMWCLRNRQVLDKAKSIAREIVENTSAVSVALGKALLWHGQAEPDPQSVHLIDSRCFFRMGCQKDSHEGVESFLQKRPPRFFMKVSSDMPDFYPWWKEPKV
jgi:enoyl-CoA hydratase/carnithine racemase